MSDFKENIKPAISNSNEAINEMSTEEFQRTLHTWFENRGIVADLRAHLRRHMIDILKDTSLGRAVSQKQTSLSPKAQIINLLIVEFLMKHKYHFTLSVFSTEVPFLSILPDYSVSVANASTEGASHLDKPVIDSSFTEQNFWDILQTLGFSLDSVYSKKLHDIYFNKNNEPLLSCIIKLLSTLCNKTDLRNEFKDNIINKSFISSDMEPWIKDIYNLLTHFDVPDEIIIKLHDHLKSIFEKEHAKIKTEESTKFNFLHTQIQKDFQSREAEICKMINEMENTFYKEKQKLSGELLNEQDKINHFKQILVEKQREYDDNLAALNRREESLKQRETEILEQTEILKSRIKIMQNVYDSIVEENARATQIKLQQKDNETNEQEKAEQTKLQLEYEYLRREIQETRETIKKFHQSISEESISKDKDHQSECEEKLLKGLLERVQAENAQLRLLNTQQQIRLDELTVRNSILMNDLENSQATINILSRSRIANQITVPPLLPPPPPPRSRSPRSGTLNGGGENLGFVPQPPTQPTYRHLVHSPPPRDSRRKVSRRLVSHSTAATESSTDDNTNSQSPTEEILREARQRLRKLEEETESVDRSYRAFKKRHSQAIQDNINLSQQTTSAHSHYMTMPEHIRPMFQPRNSREFYNTSVQNRRNNRNKNEEEYNMPDMYERKYYAVYKPSADFQFPSTSKCTENFIQVTVNPVGGADNMNNDNAMRYVEESMPGTSHGHVYSSNYQRLKDRDVEIENNNELDHNARDRDDYRSSGASSAILPQLHNLSLSSIDMSSDNPDISENKPPEKDL